MTSRFHLFRKLKFAALRVAIPYSWNVTGDNRLIPDRGACKGVDCCISHQAA